MNEKNTEDQFLLSERKHNKEIARTHDKLYKDIENL